MWFTFEKDADLGAQKLILGASGVPQFKWLLKHNEPVSIPSKYSRNAMDLFLKFLYSGFSVEESESLSKDVLNELEKLASHYKVDHLHTCVQNIKEDLSVFNESFKTLIPDQVGRSLAKVALGDKTLADAAVSYNSGKIYFNKLLVVQRCDYFRTLLSRVRWPLS